MANMVACEASAKAVCQEVVLKVVLTILHGTYKLRYLRNLESRMYSWDITFARWGSRKSILFAAFSNLISLRNVASLVTKAAIG